MKYSPGTVDTRWQRLLWRLKGWKPLVGVDISGDTFTWVIAHSDRKGIIHIDHTEYRKFNRGDR